MRIWTGIKRGDKKQTAKIGDRNLTVQSLDSVKDEWAHGKNWWQLGAVNEASGELIQPGKNIRTYCLEMLMNIYMIRL